MESNINNTNIHLRTGVKMLYLFPQVPPLPIRWPEGGGTFHELFQLNLPKLVLAAAYTERAWSQPDNSPLA